MQTKLVLLIICASLVTLGFVAPAPDLGLDFSAQRHIRTASVLASKVVNGTVNTLLKRPEP